MLILSRHPQYRLPPSAAAIRHRRRSDARSGSAPVMAELDQARDCTSGRVIFPHSPAILGTMPKAGESLDLAKRLLFSRLTMRADKLDLDGALDDVQLMLQISDRSRDEPESIAQSLRRGGTNCRVRGDRMGARSGTTVASRFGRHPPTGGNRGRPALTFASLSRRASQGSEDTLRRIGRRSPDPRRGRHVALFEDPVSRRDGNRLMAGSPDVTGGDLRRSKGVACSSTTRRSSNGSRNRRTA